MDLFIYSLRISNLFIGTILKFLLVLWLCHIVQGLLSKDCWALVEKCCPACNWLCLYHYLDSWVWGNCNSRCACLVLFSYMNVLFLCFLSASKRSVVDICSLTENVFEILNWGFSLECVSWCWDLLLGIEISYNGRDVGVPQEGVKAGFITRTS